MTKIDNPLVGITAQHNEIVKRVGNGSLDPVSVRKALQDIIEGKFAFPADRFARYQDKLLSLREQLERLRRYNRQYWANRLTEEQITSVVRRSTHVQHVTDLEILHVEFGSLEETIEMWWRVYQGEQPANWRWDKLRLDAKHCRLLGSNVRRYQPGIHRVRIDLTANWEPKTGRTVEQVQAKATRKGEILAHSEVMSVYGLHPELLSEQDGTNLPYTDMAGTVVVFPGDSKPRALCVGLNPFYREAYLLARWVGRCNRRWATPVVLRES